MNVDVTVEELQSRLRQGKVYKPEKVEQALANFFRETNISTLRELALRAVADEIGDKAASRRQREGLEPALIPERVMVCMSSSADAPRVHSRRRSDRGPPGRTLVRRLRRDAARGARQITPPIATRCSATSRWPKSLGATVVRVKADRPADGLIAFAKREGITHVIFGQTRAQPVGDPDEGIDAQPLPRGSARCRGAGRPVWAKRTHDFHLAAASGFSRSSTGAWLRPRGRLLNPRAT